jgi:hypothetical protein
MQKCVQKLNVDDLILCYYLLDKILHNNFLKSTSELEPVRPDSENQPDRFTIS